MNKCLECNVEAIPGDKNVELHAFREDESTSLELLSEPPYTIEYKCTKCEKTEEKMYSHDGENIKRDDWDHITGKHIMKPCPECGEGLRKTGVRSVNPSRKLDEKFVPDSADYYCESSTCKETRKEAGFETPLFLTQAEHDEL